MLDGKRACVIGAGFGGLALAIRLQAAGIATTLVEARDKPGGRAYYWLRDGFTFDAGPTMVLHPEAFRALWELTGHDMAADVELLPVAPSLRFNWPDGAQFDLWSDETAMRRELARFDPADIAGYDALIAHFAAMERNAGPFMEGPERRLSSVLAAVPALAKRRGWQSIGQTAARFLRNPKLREALTFSTLLRGGNPLTANALCASLQLPEAHGGMWWPRGGTNRLVAAMLRHFERLGGDARMHDPVVAVALEGTRATGVETRSGWRGRFDAVASNADIVHTYRDLLRSDPRGAQLGRRLSAKRHGHSLFVVHCGIEGGWPGIPHHMVLFGSRYEGFLQDVFDHGVLPAEFPIYLHHPTVTDPSLAPEGKSTFQAVVPVANLGRLPVDWEQLGPFLEQRVLAEVERRLIPDIGDRMVTCFHYTPRDYTLDLNAHLGSAFGFDPTWSQCGAFRPRMRDEVIGNLFRVGATIRPGGGLPDVLAGAGAVAEMMLEDLSR